MNLIDIWNQKTKAMFAYIELGKQSLEKLGFVEDSELDDQGGVTVVLRGDDKKFNTTGAFFVGVYLHTMKATELSEFDLDKVLMIFGCFFWDGDTSTGIKQSIDSNDFWDEDAFEEMHVVFYEIS